jgi:cytochrome c556
MRAKHLTQMASGAFAIALLATSAQGQNGKAAYQQRLDTMKAMGRAFYLGIGRVVKGRVEYGPATVTAADSLPPLVAKIGTLFPPGSTDPESHMKPEILSQPEKVAKLAAAVQATVPDLIAAVKSGDKASIAAAYTRTSNACDACHKEFRTEEE